MGTPTRLKMEHGTNCGHSPPAVQANITPGLSVSSLLYGTATQHTQQQQQQLHIGYQSCGGHFTSNPSFQHADFQKAALFGMKRLVTHFSIFFMKQRNINLQRFPWHLKCATASNTSCLEYAGIFSLNKHSPLSKHQLVRNVCLKELLRCTLCF